MHSRVWHDTCHIWMSHVTHMNESCLTYEWDMSHIWMSHVSHTNESCLTYESCMLHIWGVSWLSEWVSLSAICVSWRMHVCDMTHVTYESCIALTLMRHVTRYGTYMNASCHTYKWARPCARMSDTTRLHWVSCSVMQCVAVCCSVLQCVAVCCSVLQCDAVYCSALQCVAVRCSVFNEWWNTHDRVMSLVYEWHTCVAECCSVLQRVAVCCSVLQQLAVYLMSDNTPMNQTYQAWLISVLQCVAVCCSVLQRVAACCSVFDEWWHTHE